MMMDRIGYTYRTQKTTDSKQSKYLKNFNDEKDHSLQCTFTCGTHFNKLFSNCITNACCVVWGNYCRHYGILKQRNGCNYQNARAWHGPAIDHAICGSGCIPNDGFIIRLIASSVTLNVCSNGTPDTLVVLSIPEE